MNRKRLATFLIFVVICLGWLCLPGQGVAQSTSSSTPVQETNQGSSQASPPSTTQSAATTSSVVQNQNGAQKLSSIDETDYTDVVEELEDFPEFVKRTEKTIDSLNKTDALRVRLEKLKTDYGEYQQRYLYKKTLSSWGQSQAYLYFRLLEPFFVDLDKVKQIKADYLKKTEELADDLATRRQSYKNYYNSIKADPSYANQLPGVVESLAELNSLLGAVKKRRAELLGVYKSYRDVISDGRQLKEDINADMAFFKESRFLKTATALYRPEYYDQVRWSVFGEMFKTWRSSMSLNAATLPEMHYLYLAAILLSILLLGFLFKRLNKCIRSSLLQKPFVLAAMMMMVISAFLLQHVPPLHTIVFWPLMFVLLFVFSKHLLTTHDFRQEVLVLFGIYAVLAMIDALGLPVFLYRLFLIIVGLGIVVYILRRQGHYHLDKKRRWYLKAVIFLFLVAVLAEIVGFHLLADLLILGTIKSAVLLILIWGLRYSFLALIPAVMDLPRLQMMAVLSKNRDLIYVQARKIFLLLLTVFSIVAVTTIWGLYNDFFSALKALFGLGVRFGSYHLTVGRICEAYVIVFVAYLCSALLQTMLEDSVYSVKGIAAGTGKSINTLVSYAIWIVVFFLLVVTLGFEVEKIAIVAGALSVGIGFGLQTLVNNFVSGLVLLFERPIKVGDMIEVGVDEGTVEKVGLRSTVIRAYSCKQLIIPNSDLITRTVTNLTLSDNDFRMKLPVAVAPGSNTRLVTEILLNAAQKHPLVLPTPEPRVLFLTIGEGVLKFELLAWTHDVGSYTQVTSDLLFAIDEEFRKQGIEVAGPRRDLFIKAIPVG